MTKLAALSFALVTSTASLASAREIDDLAPLHEAQAPDVPRVQFGARTSIAIPSGNAYGGQALSDVFTPMSVTDIMMDIRITQRVILTPYAGFAVGLAKTSQRCESNENDDCIPFGLQVGGMLRFAYARTTRVEAWVGYAFSREWRHVGGKAFTTDFSGNDHHLLAGLDLFVRGPSKVGLYAEVAVGTYDSVSSTAIRWSTEGGAHQWTSFGIQSSF